MNTFNSPPVMDEHFEDSLNSLLSSDEFYEQVEAKLEDPIETAYWGMNLIHVAARSEEQNSRILQLLLDRGGDVNSTTPEGHTPLHFAVCIRNRSAVSTLIEAGAFVNSQDFLGRTALHFAITTRWPSPPSPLANMACDMWIVEKLLCHPEINLDPVDEAGETALMWAVKERHLEAFEALLKKGANPDIPNEDNRTPLHVALSAGDLIHQDIVDLFFKNGASIYCEDNLRQTPIDLLVQNVCYNDNLTFASFFLVSIAFRYRINEWFKCKLERIPVLSNHLDECCKEVRLMRKVIIYDKITLHDFALDCFQTQVKDPVLEIYIPVVEFLLSGFFKKYYEEIIDRIPLADLRIVLEISAGRGFSLDLLPPGACNDTIFNRIKCFYEENVLLKRQLRSPKAYLMKRT